jgi:hypothetical protein
MCPTDRDPAAVYEIEVQGELDQSWEQWFNGLAVTIESGSRQKTTTLRGPVADQAALRGILCRLWDLHLMVVSLRRIESEGSDG